MPVSTEAKERAGRQLSTVSPAAVAEIADGRVRHFDQLSHEHQRAFLRLLRGDPANAALPAGTVIVFTEYYRVERG